MTVSAGGGDSRDGGHSGQRERPIGREQLSPQLCMLVIWRLSSVANTRCAAAIAARRAAIAAEPTNTDPTYLRVGGWAQTRHRRYKNKPTSAASWLHTIE